MKRKLGLIGVLYAAILAAIAGYFFRTAQLSGGSSVPVVAFSVLMVLVFALAAVSLEKYAAYAEVYSPCRQDLAFSLLGAAGLIAGCALDFRGSVSARQPCCGRRGRSRLRPSMSLPFCSMLPSSSGTSATGRSIPPSATTASRCSP